MIEVGRSERSYPYAVPLTPGPPSASVVMFPYASYANVVIVPPAVCWKSWSVVSYA